MKKGNITSPFRYRSSPGSIGSTNHKGLDIAFPTRTHVQMSMHDRAAQFSPFAALTGFDAAVAEEARVTDRRIELEEDELQRLNERLRVFFLNDPAGVC